MIPKFPVYLFDLDGTLVDSAPDICGAVQGLFASRPHVRKVDDAFVRTYIGKHLYELFADLDLNEADFEALLAEYRGIYADRKHASTQPYPGALEGIAALTGRKSTATTKGTPTTRIVLEQFGFLPYFEHVQGTDGFPAKPAPDVIFTALAALGAKPEDCLFVGDSTSDMLAGRRAGVKIAAVRYGYGNPDDLAQYNPDYWLDDLRQLAG